MTIDLTRKKMEDYSTKQIFDIADAFLKAAERSCDSKPTEDGWVGPLIVPAIVNSAFSCELFMKSILNINHSYEAGHKLKSLFEKLPVHIRDAIITNDTKYDFLIEIEKISNAFSEWRYIYEIEVHSINLSFLMLFANVLKGFAKIELEKM